jgi:hypothetical protein
LGFSFSLKLAGFVGGHTFSCTASPRSSTLDAGLLLLLLSNDAKRQDNWILAFRGPD